MLTVKQSNDHIRKKYDDVAFKILKLRQTETINLDNDTMIHELNQKQLCK